MSEAKSAYLRHIARDILHTERRETSDNEALTSTLVNEGRHPDLIEFAGDSVLIGSAKDADSGSVRHLFRKILPYAPWKSRARVVIFQNAAGIKNEAETALLKTLEEPPANHYFFLNVQTAELLKETIRSRAAIFRYKEPHTGEGLPSDPWRRFYYLVGHRTIDTKEEEIIEAMRAAFDTISYSDDDFVALEKALYFAPKKLFEKELIARQNQALAFAALPIYAALRDKLTQGLVAPIAPIVISRMPSEIASQAAANFREYFHNLEARVFGNRPLNQTAVFYSFFFRFFAHWVG